MRLSKAGELYLGSGVEHLAFWKSAEWKRSSYIKSTLLGIVYLFILSGAMLPTTDWSIIFSQHVVILLTISAGQDSVAGPLGFFLCSFCG